MHRARAVIVGGGIGGLTAALALHLRGWEVTVLERAPALEETGAGLSLFPNAQRALDRVGLGHAVRTMSAVSGEGGLRLPSGRWLTRTTGEAVAERLGGPVVVAHRATLVGLLAGALPEGAVRLGTPVTAVEPGRAGAPARASTPEGELTADLLVAADGVGSAVRPLLFPGHPGPRYAGVTSWRFVTAPPSEPYRPHETWGRGALWGTVPLADGRVYCYATAVAPPGATARDGEHAELLRRFGSWHHPVPALLAGASPGAVLRHDIRALVTPLPAFHQGRVALLGDAAHAMTPNLGQGGCQAIEDAVVLAHLAAPGADVPAALAAYSGLRVPRATAIARRSWQLGRLSAWTSRPAVALRTGLFSLAGLLGPRAMLRGAERIAGRQAPDLPRAAG